MNSMRRNEKERKETSCKASEKKLNRFAPDKEVQLQINEALRFFEPLSRHKLNIFYGKDMIFAEAIKHSLDGVGHPVGDELDPDWYPDFFWAKGMGWPHFKKTAEICLELEKAGAAYIVEGKLKTGGRPDITVLWVPSGSEIKCSSVHKILTSGDPFHIEILDSEKELKKHKLGTYPFRIVEVMVE